MKISIASIVLLAALGGGTKATAEYNYFRLGHVISESSVVEFGLIRAEAQGRVVLYDYTGGTKGPMLGETPLHAGANADVKVQMIPFASNHVLAEIEISGQVMSTKVYTIQ